MTTQQFIKISVTMKTEIATKVRPSLLTWLSMDFSVDYICPCYRVTLGNGNPTSKVIEKINFPHQTNALGNLVYITLLPTWNASAEAFISVTWNAKCHFRVSIEI